MRKSHPRRDKAKSEFHRYGNDREDAKKNTKHSRFTTRKRYHGVSCNEPVGGFGGVSILAEVRVQEGEPLENALRRFKRKVQTEDIIKEVKRHSFYLKPGEKKRVKEALARKRNRKKVRKEQD
jgi:small subunit ribosomal protein S21